MPIKLPSGLPAEKILEEENIFIMTEDRASTQDIRPLKIVILNLMPTKIVTETQILRLLANTPLQVEFILLHPKTHISKNTSAAHLAKFYNTFDEIKDQKFDGLIITGAPVEQMPFQEVNYWEELCEIMEWSKTNVYSTVHICWGAQAGLYYHYGIEKHPLKEKMFGVFEHKVIKPETTLLRGFDEIFYCPHSRHTEVRKEDILKHSELSIITESEEAGPQLIISKDGRQIFSTGHAEYDADTLAKEYFRDKEKGLPIKVPKNYFPNDDDTKAPLIRWKANASLLFSNWLNYYVYQSTPFNLNELNKKSINKK